MKRFHALLNQKLSFKQIEENVKREAMKNRVNATEKPTEFKFTASGEEGKKDILKKLMIERRDIFDKMDEKVQETRLRMENEALENKRISPEMKKMADEFFGIEENLKQREKLLKLAGREGYFDGAKGAKLWEAPNKLRAASQSPKMGVFEGQFMDKSTVPLLERVYKNNATLVCFLFNQFGEKHIASFIDPFIKEFGKTEGIDAYEINVVEQRIKSPLVKLFQPYLKWKLGPERKSRYMVLYEDLYEKRVAMGMKNASLGWVNLVDSNGFVRWQAHGIATEGEIAALLNLTRRLMKSK